MERTEGKRLADCLAQLDATASPQQVAQAVASIFEAIELALGPIIGHMGVTALHRRSLTLAAERFQWLSGACNQAQTSLDCNALKDSLAQQRRDDAIAAGTLILDTLQELLTSLVGPALTERLLRNVWENPSYPLQQDKGHD